MRMKLLVASIATLGASGCVNGTGLLGKDTYVVTNATPHSITLRFREGDLNVAGERAQAHCQQNQRTAEMVGVTPINGQSLGTYRCV